MASLLVLTEPENSPLHHRRHALRDPRKVLWCFIIQIITQNAVEDPKSPLRCGASQSPRRVMYPCRSPADALIVHSCPPPPCQQQGLLTLSCPHKAMLIHTTKTFLFLCVNRKVLTSWRLLKHGAIKLTEIWLKMWLHQVTDACVQSSHRQCFQNGNKGLWSRERCRGRVRLTAVSSRTRTGVTSGHSLYALGFSGLLAIKEHYCYIILPALLPLNVDIVSL